MELTRGTVGGMKARLIICKMCESRLPFSFCHVSLEKERSEVIIGTFGRGDYDESDFDGDWT